MILLVRKYEQKEGEVLKGTKNIEFDYSKLRGRIREKFGSYKEMKPYLSFTPVTLSRKLNNKGYFGSDEIVELSEVLDIAEEDMNEYFFNLIVRKNEPEAGKEVYVNDNKKKANN